MDGMMCEAIRIGVTVANEFQGTAWRKKSGGGPYISFCSTLIVQAGGVGRLLAEWELERDWRQELRSTLGGADGK